MFTRSSMKLTRLIKNKLFTMSQSTGTRGHQLKIYKRRFRLNIRDNYFSNRVIDLWNELHAHNPPRFAPNVLNGLKLSWRVVEVPVSPRFFTNHYDTTAIHANVSTVLLRIMSMHHDLINWGES